MLSIICGISTALCWGVADFIGGSNSRKVGPYSMTLGTIGCGLLFLLLASPVLAKSSLDASGWIICILAGAFDAVGILLLYLSMTLGRLSLAAPVSALTAAALPVLFGIFTQGIPELPILSGLILALVAVGLVSQEHDQEFAGPASLRELWMPLISGSCLGIFLILMHAGSGNALLWPMVAVRTGGVSVLLLFLLTPLRTKLAPQLALPWRIIVVNALLDVGGNGTFILAGQYGRMDVAAVLSALYPSATVFMAWLILKERVTRIQLTGILSAFVAIALLAV